MNPALVPVVMVPLAWLLMLATEARWPARRYPAVGGWRRLGAGFFAVVAVTGTLTPVLWEWVGLTRLRLLELGGLGWYGYPLGLVLVSGLTYGWHRAAHRFDFLWRATHQLHHSPERVDVAGAFFTHPLEVVVKTSLGVLGTTVVLGLAPPVAAMVSSTLAVLSIFGHWNVNTPRWLGYLVPRPEMHAVHHHAGHTPRNFGDLPCWDVLFGTYINPRRFEGAVGFGFSTTGRLIDLLLMRDVSSARPSGSRGRTRARTGCT